MKLSPLFLLSLHFLLIPSISSYDQDLEALLAFKEHVTDATGILAANWTADTSFCSWVGILCSGHSRRQRVEVLDLYSFSLQGTISPYLGNLSFLLKLNLGNNSLTGSIPESLGGLPRIQWINLGQNHLAGHIPRGFFNMSELLGIYLQSNNLTGSLPSNSSLFMLPQIQNISIGENQLTGLISSGLALCRSLQFLNLFNNDFTGMIPEELGHLQNLTNLSLARNQLTGAIPASLGNLTNLQMLSLSFNQLEGVIPDTLGNLQNLQNLHLAKNRLTSSIPVSIFNASMLQIVELSGNNLTGSIPVEIGKSVPLLTVLLMSLNQLTGGLEFITSLSNCRNLLALDVAANELDGVIPDSVGNLSAYLQHFNVGENKIKGSIPPNLGNLSSLYLLDAAVNELSGTIPLELSRLQNLEVFYLAVNRIRGPIPFELGLMTRLNDVNLKTNLLYGPIPDSVGNLSMLQRFSLAFNTLSSSIPISLWSLSGLISLSLEDNILNGTIPLQVGNLNSLNTLDISHNRLSGNISTTFGKLQMLTHLDLSDNSFGGSIPESFGRLINIQYLNLSHNSLSNAIPDSISNLRYLNSLDLSFNNLEGLIPSGRVFSNISIVSLVGNTALCGAPSLKFPPCKKNSDPSTSRRKSHLLSFVLAPIASVIVILVFFLLLFKFCGRSRPKTPTDESARSDDHDQISYYELARATGNFSEANLVGRGGFGSIFKARLDNGLVVAVKVLNLEVQGALKSFDAECQALRMVRHRNLVKIISVCSNLDFKALILQFMVNGSLEDWLYSDEHYLSLQTRLNAMVDVSLALEYLHHHHGNVVLHCDLKPSNVLLDENMVAHLSDFGIAKLLHGDNASSVMTSSTGTIGYMAPEYAYSGQVSRKGDIYSFGILLLETFTGKKPTDAMFSEELNLRQWVSNAYPDALLQIVDRDILREDTIEHLQGEFSTIVGQCLSSIIELGLLCSNDSPKERMLMEDIVPRFQKIRMEYLAKMAHA